MPDAVTLQAIALVWIIMCVFSFIILGGIRTNDSAETEISLSKKETFEE